MDLAHYRDTFWEQGYLVIEDFFDAALMDHLDRVIMDHYGANPDFWHNDEFLTKSKTEVVPWFPQDEGVPDFDQIDAYAHFNEITEAVLGEGWQRLYCMVMFSKQGTTGQAWHQDCAPENPNLYNLNRLVYTSDITEAIGGQTVVVPGTHKTGLLPAGNPDVDFERQVVLTPKKGTLVLLHGHTWHCVLPIHGPYRVSTNYRAIPQGAPRDLTDICVYRNMRYQFSTSSVVEERFVAEVQ